MCERNYIFIIGLVFVINPLCESAEILIPDIPGTYRSYGEYVIHFEKESRRVQIAFEDNYDSVNNVNSLWVATAGNPTIFLDYSKKSWTIDSKGCNSFNRSSMIDTGSNFRMFKTPLGDDIFLPHELVRLYNHGVITPEKKPPIVKYRGIASIKYEYRFNKLDTSITITAHWSDNSHHSTSTEKVVPLGFEIKHNSKGVVTYHSVNIYLFLHDEINTDRFLPKVGVKCPGFEGKKLFPDISELKSLQFRTEFLWRGNASFVDTWFDTNNKILRVDFTPHHLKALSPDKSEVQSSYVMSLAQGNVYSRYRDGKPGAPYEISSLPYYPELILNLKDLNDWTMNAFFGLPKNKFFHTGTSEFGGVACDVFQAERDDWPPTSPQGNVISIWEWCFINNKENGTDFPKNAFPSFSLKIYVTSAVEGSPASKGDELVYHFYDIRIYDTDYLTTFAFDITDVFPDKHLMELKFRVPLDKDKVGKLQDTFTNYKFNSAWRAAITEAAGLNSTSLRISRVQTFMVNSDYMEVYFTLLNRHPDLPTPTKRAEPLNTDVYKKLVAVVLQSDMKIFWPPEAPKAKAMMLVATPSTLFVRAAFNQTFSEGKPMMVQLMQDREKSQATGISATSLAMVCGVTLLVGVALGMVVMHKIRIGQRAKE